MGAHVKFEDSKMHERYYVEMASGIFESQQHILKLSIKK